MHQGRGDRAGADRRGVARDLHRGDQRREERARGVGRPPPPEHRRHAHENFRHRDRAFAAPATRSPRGVRHLSRHRRRSSRTPATAGSPTSRRTPDAELALVPEPHRARGFGCRAGVLREYGVADDHQAHGASRPKSQRHAEPRRTARRSRRPILAAVIAHPLASTARRERRRRSPSSPPRDRESSARRTSSRQSLQLALERRSSAQRSTARL